jgi:hypothetical protein
MGDITYCSCIVCVNKECERHLSNLLKLEKTQVVSIADFSGVCRDYIGQLVDAAFERGDSAWAVV